MSLVTRPLETDAEYRAAVALQRLVWGEDFDELVPASMLKVAQQVGGIASGAFEGDRLIGFVFGISGFRDGRPTHWSDMLAVEPAWRGRGVGRVLKLHQRELLLALGVERMLWTFDPLVARNAHLNLSRLGATARTYLRDVYGQSASPLHSGIGTDRLVAEWELRSPRTADQPENDDAPFLAMPAPVDTGLPAPGEWTENAGPARVRLAIPADIQALKEADPALARAWRQHVREGLERAFRDGYVAVAASAPEGGLAAYTLVRAFSR